MTQKTFINHHYEMIRKSQTQVIDKLDAELRFFRIYFDEKFSSIEIIYDTPNNLLTNAGIVLSKLYDGEKYFFRVRKQSYLPIELRKNAIKKYFISTCQPNHTPKDFPLQIASAINDAFQNIFTIDLVDVVKQTIPKYEIKVKGDIYTLASGNGMKGQLVFEKVIYKDFSTGRKVKQNCVNLRLPEGDQFAKEKEEVIDAIDRKCKELLPYSENRFEIARRLLKPRVNNEKFDRKAFKQKIKEQSESEVEQ